MEAYQKRHALGRFIILLEIYSLYSFWSIPLAWPATKYSNCQKFWTTSNMIPTVSSKVSISNWLQSWLW
jgi:hypothetical protein